MGDSVSVSRALRQFRSTARRRDMRAKSTMLRLDREVGSYPGQLMLRCWRLIRAEKARMKAGTFVAAWNSAGYCLVKISVVPKSPYFGRRGEERSSCGVYVKFISLPVSGSTSGGKNVSAVCGMLKRSALT